MNTFDQNARKAAREASMATSEAMRAYAEGQITDEDDITGVLIGELNAAFRNLKTGDMIWSSSILRHRSGTAAEEKTVGADMIFHLDIRTDKISLSKGVLVQAKRNRPGTLMSKSAHRELLDQCKKMKAASCGPYVFNYAKSGMRCAPSSRIEASTDRNIHDQCIWTPYRFFLEFIRCPVGDTSLKSALVKDLPVANKLFVTGRSASQMKST